MPSSTLVVVIERGLIRPPVETAHLIEPADGRYVCILTDHAGDWCQEHGMAPAGAN